MKHEGHTGHRAWFLAYVGASLVRGLMVGTGVWLATLAFAAPQMAQPLWALVFAMLGGCLLGSLGLIAGLWADKFDQMAAFQNFIDRAWISARILSPRAW